MTVATASAANPIVGARRVRQIQGDLQRIGRRHHRGPLGPPAGTEVWQISDDLQDLREHAFVTGRNHAEIVAALEAQYPAGHPLLTRVEGLALQPEWNGTRLVYPPPLQYLVHVHALLDMSIAAQKLGGGAGPEQVLHALAGRDTRVATLDTLTRAHGAVLMHRDHAESLRADSGFDESSIVVAPFTGTGYALVKFNPLKAKARRTREDNQAARVAHAEELGTAAAEMRTRIDALSQALIDDLTVNGSFLGYALPNREDSHDADDWEPRRYEHRRYYGAWSGRPYSTGNSAPGQTRKCLARLYALAKIHEQFRGRRAYRRLPQWAAARAQYAKLPNGLDPERWGRWVGPLTTFWNGEMHARAPRTKAVIKTDGEPAHRGPHDGSNADDDQGENEDGEEA